MRTLNNIEIAAPLPKFAEVSHSTADNTIMIKLQHRWPIINNVEAKKTGSNSIESLQELKADWNGNGAKAFKKQLLDKVKLFVDRISYHTHVFPTGRDSVQLEFYKPNKEYLELEISENEISGLHSYPTGEMNEFILPNINEAHKKIDFFFTTITPQ